MSIAITFWLSLYCSQDQKNAIRQWETRNSFLQTLPITAMTLDHGDLKYASLATGSPQGDESGEAGLKT
jgi:hypothetical protein